MNIDVKKLGIVGGVVLVIILICILSVQMTQNTAIGYEEKIEAAKSNITVVEKSVMISLQILLLVLKHMISMNMKHLWL